MFRNARGHALREANSPLKFPITGSNDVVLALRQYVRQTLPSTQHLSVNLYTCFRTKHSFQVMNSISSLA